MHFYYMHSPVALALAVLGGVLWVIVDFFYTSRARVAISVVRFDPGPGSVEMVISLWNWGVSPARAVVIRPTYHWLGPEPNTAMHRLGGQRLTLDRPLAVDETVELTLTPPVGFSDEGDNQRFLHFILDCRTSQFWLWRRKGRIRQAFVYRANGWQEVMGSVLRHNISASKIRARRRERAEERARLL